MALKYAIGEMTLRIEEEKFRLKAADYEGFDKVIVVLFSLNN